MIYQPLTLQAKARLLKARAGLMTHCPFLGHLCLQLPVYLTDDPRIETAAITGGGTCLFNPAFLESLSAEELSVILLHETLHLALDVHHRRGGRSRRLWNIAHDYAVNALIEESMGRGHNSKWPEQFPPLLDMAFANLPAESIYDLLLDAWRLERGMAFPEDEGRRLFWEICEEGERGRTPSVPDRWTPEQIAAARNALGSFRLTVFDLLAGWSELDGASQERLREHWQRALCEAAERGMLEQWGNLPGWADKLLGPILRPKLPWPQLLALRIHGHLLGERRSYARPGRRGASIGQIFPGRMHHRGIVGVFIDVSGSIGPTALAAFLAELQGILEETSQCCRLFTWDVVVHEDLFLEDAGGLSTELGSCARPIKGGGGNDLRCLISHLEAEPEPAPSLGILLTDGYLLWPPASDWPIPIIVVSTKELPPPMLGYEAVLLPST